MHYSKLFACVGITIFSFSFCFAQSDSSKIKNDSVNNRLISIQSKQLQILEAERLADSLKTEELQQKLKALKSTDLLKKEDLLQQIQQMKSKDSLQIVSKKQKIDSLKKVVTGFPVVPFLDTLFYIYNPLGSFSAEDRANAITIRIKNVAGNYFFSADSVYVKESETSVDIFYKENILLSISQNDALWENTSPTDLANRYAQKIKAVITQYKKDTSWQTLIKQFLLALVVIIALFFLIKLINRLFRVISSKIIQQENKLIKGIKIRNYELFSASMQLNILLVINTAIKWLVIFIIIYLAFPILFGIFPWTKSIADTLLSYFITPLKKIGSSFWNYLPNLFTIAVIVIFFRFAMKGIRYLKNEVETERLKIPGFYADWANPTYQIIRVLFYAFLFIVIFPYLPGSNSPVFQGVSVFLGVLFTFGSSGSLSNVVAGLVLTYMRAFKIGDRIKINDITGDVIEKTMLVTRIRTIKNEIISIPNSSVMSSHTINYSSEAIEKGLIVHTTVTIGYDAPWRQVHQLLIDAALATDMIDKNPEPFVLQTSLDDFYVSYQINAYTKQPNKQASVYSMLHANIQDKFNEAGVEIMSPHYSTLRDGNQTTIPQDYLQKDYVAPSFSIKNTDSKNK